MENNSEFGSINVSKTIKDIHNRLSKCISDMETLLTLPIDYIKSNMSHDDFNNYLNMRSKTIDVLNLLEVFVYDTHEKKVKCYECGETELQLVNRRRNGIDVETINGEIEHWAGRDGEILHIFICEECIKKSRQK